MQNLQLILTVIDAMGSVGMFLAGMVMVTRNRCVDTYCRRLLGVFAHPSMHRVSNNRSAIRFGQLDL